MHREQTVSYTLATSPFKVNKQFGNKAVLVVRYWSEMRDFIVKYIQRSVPLILPDLTVAGY